MLRPRLDGAPQLGLIILLAGLWTSTPNDAATLGGIAATTTSTTTEASVVLDANVTVPASDTATTKPTGNLSNTCFTKHLTGSIDQLQVLQKCATVAGNLVITFMEEPSRRNRSAVGTSLLDYTFPKLIEITGFLIIHQLHGIRTLSHMFPNLRVIRGQQLVHRFALVVVGNTDLVDIAFPSLTTIGRGYVMFRDNPNLCYIDSIDWDRITVDEQQDYDQTDAHNFVQVSRHAKDNCPLRIDCANCTEKLCWNQHDCQQFETGMNAHGNITCHKHCIGGCTNETASGCIRCRGLHHDGTCVDACPADLFRNDYIFGCGSEALCNMYNLIAMDGECKRSCPEGYSHLLHPTQPYDIWKCHPCPGGRCLRVCSGGFIGWHLDASSFADCQVLNGSLLVQLHHEEADVQRVLLHNLRNIEVIYGTLEVHRSEGLSDLTFLRALRLVEPLDDDQLLAGNYSVKVWGNPVLTRLWDWRVQPNISVTRGRVGVLDNPLLCATHLAELREHLSDGGGGVNDTTRWLDERSNGGQAICETKDIATQVVGVRHDGALLQWRPFVPETGYVVIGYDVFHAEVESEMMEYSDGMYTCRQRHWHTNFVPTGITNPLAALYSSNVTAPSSTVNGWLQQELTNLRQRQNYAYYVQAHVVWSNETTSPTIVQGRSEIRNFTSGTRLPLPPFVFTESKTNTSITLQWFHPAWDTDRYVEEYVIDVIRLPDDVEQLLHQRDYCLHPKEAAAPHPVTYIATEAETDDDGGGGGGGGGADDNCCGRHPRFLVPSLFGLDGDPDACSADDHSCRGRHVDHRLQLNESWYADTADRLAAVRAEELPLMQPMLEALLNYVPRRRSPDVIPKGDPNYVRTVRVGSDVGLLPLNDLLPFERYAIRVHACTVATECGAFYQHFERTLRSPDADHMELRILSDDEMPDKLLLKIERPKRPNGGMVVSYEVERFVGEMQEAHWCVTTMDMERTKYILRLADFSPGLYRIRARAITLASTGNWSEIVLHATAAPSAPTLSNHLAWLPKLHWFAWLSIATLVTLLGIFCYTFRYIWMVTLRIRQPLTTPSRFEPMRYNAASGRMMNGDEETTTVDQIDPQQHQQRPQLRRADSTETLMSMLSIDEDPVAAILKAPPAVRRDPSARSEALHARLLAIASRNGQADAVVAFGDESCSDLFGDRVRLISCNDEALSEVVSVMEMQLLSDDDDSSDTPEIAGVDDNDDDAGHISVHIA